MNRVLEQHPNLSVFHHDHDDTPLPAPSPPGSPSRSGRRGLLRRISRLPKDDSESSQTPPHGRFPISLPKKVKSTLSLKGNGEFRQFVPPEVVLMFRQ